MGFKNESELYDHIRARHNILGREYLDNPDINKAMNDEREPIIRQRDKRTLYVLVEAHGSIAPINYTHENLVPKIKINPNTWLILRELKDVEADPFSPRHISHSYFQELSKLFGIPSEDPIADILSQDTRDYIRRASNISERDIDRSLITLVVGERDQQRLDHQFLASELVGHLKKPYHYILELLSLGPYRYAEFLQNVGKPWNEYSRQRFQGLLEKYPEKTSILVSAGAGHLPVFE